MLSFKLLFASAQALQLRIKRLLCPFFLPKKATESCSQTVQFPLKLLAELLLFYHLPPVLISTTFCETFFVQQDILQGAAASCIGTPFTVLLKSQLCCKGL